MIRLKRVYDQPASVDGQRVLVERLWPRGLSKDRLQLTAWLKDVAPSTALRQWFGHDPDKWHEFRTRYFRELDRHPDAWRPLLEAAQRGTVTLVFSSRDTSHNNAVALKDYLETQATGTTRGRRRSPS